MSDLDTRRHRLLPTLLILIGAAAVVLLVDAWTRKPAAPRSGDGLSTTWGQPEKRPRASLRIAQFNIRGGRGMDGDVDLIRTANLLGSFDIIGLNEVRGRLFGSPRNQVEDLAKILEAPWMFAPAEYRFWHDSFGNGLLSRLPVRHYTVLNLPGTERAGRRNVVLARVPLDGAVVNLLITHLDRVTDRAAQFQIIAETFLSLDEPAILIGDFNLTRDQPQMQQLLQAAGVEDTIGDTDSTPEKERVDWILTRGLQTLEAGAVSSSVSDHPLIWAHLVIPPATIEKPTSQPARRAETKQTP